MKPKRLIAEMAGYDIELPHPLELAKLAAAVGPRDNFREAIRNAVKLWRETRQFHEDFKTAPLEERALMFDDWRTAGFGDVAVSSLHPEADGLPYPEKFPATLDDFLRLVVRARTSADSEKRLRDFFRNEFKHLQAYRALPANSRDRGSDCYRNCHDYLRRCRKRQDESDFAGGEIGRLKTKGLNDDQWYALGCDYLAWWKNQVAEANRRNRKGKCPAGKSRDISAQTP